MTKAIRPTTNNAYFPIRWNPIGGSDIKKAQTLWPIASSTWKEFKVRGLREDTSGTTTVQRQVNEVDVGVALTFSSSDSFPVTKTDSNPVAIGIGDRLAVRFHDSVFSSPFSWMNCWSYIEFADGLWGF